MSSNLHLLNVVHSFMRYIVIILALLVTIQSIMGITGKKEFGPANRKGPLFLMISCDIQLLVGFLIYFLGGHMDVMKTSGAMHDKYARFFAMEHPLSMVIAIVLVHVGYSFAKKNVESKRKFVRLLWCSLLALIIFIAMTPWPGKAVVGKPWLAMAATTR